MLKSLQITHMDSAEVTEGQLFEACWFRGMQCPDPSSRVEYYLSLIPQGTGWAEVCTAGRGHRAQTTVNNKQTDPIVMINNLEEVKIIST